MSCSPLTFLHTFCSRIVSTSFSVCTLIPLWHFLLFSVTKGSKSTLYLTGPKEVIITAKVLYYLFFSTISAHLFRYLQSVLIGDYSISALCFSGGLFRTSLFKTAFIYCDRYFLLLPRFVHFALPSAPVYSLLAPVVAIGCFSRFLRGWFLASLLEGGGFALAKSEGVVLRSALCVLRSNSSLLTPNS